MSDNPYSPATSAGIPEIRQRPVRVSLVWLVPIAAALVGFSMVVQNWLSAGPQISVSFETAEGLEANKTQVKYKNVVIGQVTEIALSEDHTRVIATIELDQNAEPFTREDTKFWVVRPRIGASGVSRRRHPAVRRLHRRGCGACRRNPPRIRWPGSAATGDLWRQGQAVHPEHR